MELSVLSDWLARVQEAVKENFPGLETLIGGGSARDILDHVYFGRPLVTRDIDLFLVNGGPVNPCQAQVFFQRMQEMGLGTLKSQALRLKKRCNPALPVHERYDYVAGYGAHFFREGFPILSVGILHTDYDLRLNGLLNIDKIYLRLSPGESLVEYCAQIARHRVRYWELARLGYILDESNGYAAWVESRPELLNWHEVERSPLRQAVRITRSFAKAGCPRLPEEVGSRFRELVARSPHIDDETEFKRGFVKVFGDRHWTHELDTLAYLGVLPYISQELGRVAGTLKDAAGGENWRERWDAVLGALSAEERLRLQRELEPALATSFGN